MFSTYNNTVVFVYGYVHLTKKSNMKAFIRKKSSPNNKRTYVLALGHVNSQLYLFVTSKYGKHFSNLKTTCKIFKIFIK